ncbi:hypothetical protein ACFQ0X_11680 [Streptomyces rectiviolaceus]|uniref:hypothetical protein n=1 Tax=Streptomyces rectiviolaceus TaxID=332591 RepID=UPI0036431B9A
MGQREPLVVVPREPVQDGAATESVLPGEQDDGHVVAELPFPARPFVVRQAGE